jgi:hypothetical protein
MLHPVGVGRSYYVSKTGGVLRKPPAKSFDPIFGVDLRCIRHRFAPSTTILCLALDALVVGGFLVNERSGDDHSGVLPKLNRSIFVKSLKIAVRQAARALT